jgi:hypothetical protein
MLPPIADLAACLLLMTPLSGHLVAFLLLQGTLTADSIAFLPLITLLIGDSVAFFAPPDTSALPYTTYMKHMMHLEYFWCTQIVFVITSHIAASSFCHCNVMTPHLCLQNRPS